MLNIDNSDPNQYSILKRDTAANYIGSEARLVTDSAVMRDVVTKLGWPDNPQVITAWEAQTGGVGDIRDWAAGQIGANVNVQQLEDSAILEINYTTSSLDAAKQIVAMIRTSYIEESQRLRAEAARRAAAWNRTKVRQALDILLAAEAARAAFVTANQIAVDTPVGGLDYQAQFTALNSAAASLPTTITTPPPADPVVNTLRTKLNSLDAQIAVLKLRGDENPATVALEAERATTAQQLARETAVADSGPNATDEQIGLVRAQRDATYLQTRLHLIERSPLYDRLAMMDRDIFLKANRYNAAAARVAAFDAVAAAPSGLKVIGDVIASDDPTFPNIPLTIGVAAGASLALAVTLAVLGALIRGQVRDVEDLRFSVGAPVLAVIVADRPRRGLAVMGAAADDSGVHPPRPEPPEPGLQGRDQRRLTPPADVAGAVRRGQSDIMAESEGFEPSVPVTQYGSLANCWFQPLTHDSEAAAIPGPLPPRNLPPDAAVRDPAPRHFVGAIDVAQVDDDRLRHGRRDPVHVEAAEGIPFGHQHGDVGPGDAGVRVARIVDVGQDELGLLDRPRDRRRGHAPRRPGAPGRRRSPANRACRRCSA